MKDVVDGIAQTHVLGVNQVLILPELANAPVSSGDSFEVSQQKGNNNNNNQFLVVLHNIPLVGILSLYEMFSLRDKKRKLVGPPPFES